MADPNVKTIGRGAACDLVLDDPSVSLLHARLSLSRDGYLYVEDAGSDQGTWLERNDRSVRVLRATLCVGDHIRFGGALAPLERLTRLYAASDEVKLRPRPALKMPETRRARPAPVPGPMAPKRRNPATGNLEENPREN